MDVYDFLKKNIRELRMAEGLTQQGLADKTKIPRANLSRYETGENIPPLDILVRLASFFDVTVGQLLGVEK